jgi:hypothetical protein
MKQLNCPARLSDLATWQFVQLSDPIREGYMGVPEILATIDSEIAKLQQARALLSGLGAPAAKKKAGRPKKVAAAAKKAAVVAHASTKPEKKRRKKRHLSAEGRKRIAEAVKKRWAAQKAASGK